MTKADEHAQAERSLDEAQAALLRGDHEGCLAALEVAHEAGHDHARIHFTVHTTWLKLALRLKDLRMAVGQVAPILFAVPVSFVRRAAGV